MKGEARVETASPEDQGPLALRIQDLEAQLRAAREALTEARRSFHQQCLEAQEAADLKIRVLEAECLQVVQERDRIEASFEALRQRVHPLETECLETLLENRRLQSELDEREGAKILADEALKTLEDRLFSLKQQLSAEKVRTIGLEQDLQRVYASASFRVTRPLRALKALLLPRASS